MSLSAGQITLLRTTPQYSKLGLALLQPHTILACQLNQSFTTRDMVTELTFDNVTEGSYSNVLAGMTAFVGTTAGAHDLGYCRIRKTATSDTLYIGEASDIKFANNYYITIVDAFEPWPKHLVVTSDEVFMDVGVAYSDQHTNFDPIPILGGQVVLDVASYPATVTFPEVVNSWVFDSTISAYLTSASEGTVTNETTNNPTLTVASYPTNGYIRVSLLVTAANGNTYTGYVYVFVFDSTHRPITDFTLESCGCNRDDGGWSARVTLNDSDDIGLARFRGLAVLFSKDYFNGVENTSVGLYTGRENIWFSGWVYEHTSVNDPSFEPRTFDIQGAQFWLSRMPSFPVGVELSSTTADAWTNMEGLTVDKGLYHFLHWRTTITSIMDVYLTDDTRYSPAVESPAGNLWGQLKDIGNLQIGAWPTCDHNGKLCVKIPYNLLPSADRAAASTKVMDLITLDYERGVEINARAPQVAQVVLSGVSADEYGNDTEIFSLAPGHTPALLGELLPVTNQLLADQTQANQFAGLVFAAQNNPYPDIPLTLNSINRAFDIAPLLYGTVTGLSEYSGTVIPNSIDYSFDHKTGKTQIDISFEGETDENDAIFIDGDIPDGEGGTIPITHLGHMPPLAPIDLPDIPAFPTTSPTTTQDCGSEYKNFFSLVWSKPYLDGTDSNKLVSNANFSCKIRSNPRTQTFIDFSCKVHGDAASHIHVYGMYGGSKVATASLSAGIGVYTFRANFTVLSDTLVDGFQIELDAGVGTVIESAVAGSVVSSGSVAGNVEAGTNIATTAGGSYCIDGSGGPWKPGPAFPNNYYTFSLDGNGSIGKNDTVFNLSLPTIGLYAVQLDADYGRCFFIADDADINFRCADSAGNFADNSGSLGYSLRSAVITGRALNIYDSVLNNVCAPS